MKATNPYSGESAMLSEEEFALYHLIKHAEETEQYDAMQKGLSKFSRMNAAAYMTLLDYPSYIHVRTCWFTHTIPHTSHRGTTPNNHTARYKRPYIPFI